MKEYTHIPSLSTFQGAVFDIFDFKVDLYHFYVIIEGFSVFLKLNNAKDFL